MTHSKFSKILTNYCVAISFIIISSMVEIHSIFIARLIFAGPVTIDDFMFNFNYGYMFADGLLGDMYVATSLSFS